MSFKELKTAAKQAIAKDRGACIVILLLITIASGILQGLAAFLAKHDLGMISSIISLASIIIIIPLTIGAIRAYMRIRATGQSDYNDLLTGFNDNFINTVLVMFVTSMFISLWTLLFVIPGIIFGLKWQMVPYIIAENPNISGKEARRISSAMMDGHKMDLFLLQLSFIGWAILSVITCGILYFVYVGPYMQMTYIEFFDKVKSEYQMRLESMPQ